MSEQDDLLAEGRTAFEQCADAESENRKTALEDMKFARNSEQWPEAIAKERQQDGRPMLTINKLPAFARQVVNDARMNKPQIRVSPVDDNADEETADVIADLIRNIEYTSNAAAAYDTAVESAVYGGVGYWRITADYAHDDSFEMDLRIKRVRNPFSVYGDPNSLEVDSSDWDVAFVVDRLSKTQFEAEYGEKAKVDWSDVEAWGGENWRESETVNVAEWWKRERVTKKLIQYRDLRNGAVYMSWAEGFEKDPDLMALQQAGMLEFLREREAPTQKVMQRIMSGAEVLEENEWAGRFIPIVPVYGDEYDIEGKVYRRGLVHDAIDAQRMFNYWRTVATELVALAPKTPWIGRKGTFDSDSNRWSTANTRSHSYLEFDGEMPRRIPLDSGPAAGALQESLNASDDIKSVIGMYDASLGARSNEISGKAILARQREGDVATFHFQDNLTRAIRHTGCILVDLLPHYYDEERVIRVRGEDDSERAVQINSPYPQTDQNGNPVMEQQQDEAGNMVSTPVLAMHDLTTGKYDVTVAAGPSFTTRRQEAAAEMTEIIRAYPQIAPLVADLLAKNLDWPGSDEIAERLKRMVPQEALGDDGGVPPQLQKFIEEGQALIKTLTQRVQELETDRSIDMAKVGVDAFEAQTDRMQAEDQRAGVMPSAPNPLGTTQNIGL